MNNYTDNLLVMPKMTLALANTTITNTCTYPHTQTQTYTRAHARTYTHTHTWVGNGFGTWVDNGFRNGFCKTTGREIKQPTRSRLLLLASEAMIHGPHANRRENKRKTRRASE